MRSGGRLWDYSDANPHSRTVTDALPVIAVPTTAGTGSEVTSLAVFHHRGGGACGELPLKATAYGPALAPRIALVDPELAVGSPAGATAASAADALGHALEAFICRRANPISSLLAGARRGWCFRSCPVPWRLPTIPNREKGLPWRQRLPALRSTRRE